MKKFCMLLVFVMFFVSLTSATIPQWPGNVTIRLSEYNLSVFETPAFMDDGLAGGINTIGPTLTQTNFAKIGNAGSIPPGYKSKSIAYVGTPISKDDPRK